MKVVIIGGVAGGMSAATRLRRLREDAEIVVLERSGHVSFANCGLPYHVGGVIESRDALLLQTPQSLAARFGIDVKVRHEALSIDRDARTIAVRDLDRDETTEIPYDVLILSPGARPVRPPIEGIERAFALRDIEDTDALVVAVGREPRSAVVIGAGFIGVELAENLLHRGIATTIIEATDQVMPPLDPEFAIRIEQALTGAGAEVITSASVTSIGSDSVTLSDGRTLPAELVVAAVGVAPDSRLAADAGLELGPRGAIVVDDQLRTSDPHIYAVGDATTKRDAVDGSATLVPLASPANRHGRLVADVIAGRTTAASGVLGTAIVGVCGLTAATTGWSEKRLRASGRPVRVIHTHPASHACYYPGAESMALKLLVDPETDAILGAQGVGGEGVDKRIDVIATAMRAGMKASDLADLELAYAPAFSSAKDPVNMLGYVAENLRDGITDSVQWHELAELTGPGGATLLDVRSRGEFEAGAIPGAINIPVDDLRDRLGELPSGELVVHCAVGVRGHIATRILAQNGRPARNLDGGYKTWADGMAAGHP